VVRKEELSRQDDNSQEFQQYNMYVLFFFNEICAIIGKILACLHKEPLPRAVKVVWIKEIEG